MAKKNSPAVRANRTRKAREAFQSRYGTLSYETVRLLQTTNLSADDIADRLWSTSRSVSATLANLNRTGLFRTMALACNF